MPSNNPIKPAKRKVLPLVGPYDLPDMKLSKDDKKKLLTVVNKSVKNGNEFLDQIELAIRRAIGKRTLEVKRAEAKKALRKAAATAEDFLKALREIPFPAQSYYSREGVRHRVAERQMVELVATATRAANCADEELSGQGNTKKNNHTLFAADIAKALEQIGIEPKAYRPRETEEGNEFWQVSSICFPLAGLGVEDPLPYLINGLELSKNIRE